MIFSNDKCCVCPRDIEICLSAVFLCLAAALPHHNIYIFLIIKNGGTSPLIIRIISIIIIYLQFLSYLANTSFLLDRITFNFYLIFIALPDSSIL